MYFAIVFAAVKQRMWPVRLLNVKKSFDGESITGTIPVKSKSRTRFVTISSGVNRAQLRLLVHFAGTHFRGMLTMDFHAPQGPRLRSAAWEGRGAAASHLDYD
jgi:hypothetical protein